MRLIDADILIQDTIQEYARSKQYRDAVIRMVNKAPTVEPKRGEWICHKGKWIDFDYYPTKYECSQCHHYVDVASDKNFCPNCGADMRGKGDE